MTILSSGAEKPGWRFTHRRID